jgi:hypothetical protein
LVIELDFTPETTSNRIVSVASEPPLYWRELALVRLKPS